MFKARPNKPIGERHLGRPRRSGDENIKINLKEVTRNCVISSEYGLLESPCIFGIEPPASKSLKLLLLLILLLLLFFYLFCQSSITFNTFVYILTT
jgi:hypothetical protein